MTDTSIETAVSLVVQAREKILAPRPEHGRLLQECAEELGRKYRDLETQLYDVRRALLYILPDLEKCGRILDEEIATVQRLIEEANDAYQRAKYAARYARRHEKKAVEVRGPTP